MFFCFNVVLDNIFLFLNLLIKCCFFLLMKIKFEGVIINLVNNVFVFGLEIGIIWENFIFMMLVFVCIFKCILLFVIVGEFVVLMLLGILF